MDLFHHSVASLQVVDGENDLHILGVAANTLNKQPQLSTKGGSSAL
jgi:hypothetical protein